jgi:hypothetical protein
VPKRGKNWKPPQQRRPATPEGAPPTKREERRLEAERRREAIRKSAARRRRLRRVGLIAGVLAVAGGVAAYALTRPPGVSSSTLEARLLRQAPAATKAAGCSSVQTVPPYSTKNDRTHVSQLPPLSTYKSIPPASGPHFPTPLDAGVYNDPPTLGMAIHSLEHAAAEIWLSPDASGSEVDRLKSFFKRTDESEKVIVAPYDYPGQGGQLPAGQQMVLVAWHHIQQCGQVSLPVAYAFVHDYRLDPSHPGQYKGVAPEPTTPI